MIRILAFLMLMPMAAQAGAWEEFEARCLTPYEALFPPIIDGLPPIGADPDTPKYLLPGGRLLVIEMTPKDGLTACFLLDVTGQAEQGFDAWIESAVSAGRYVAVGENVWHSLEWIEPVLEVSKRTGAPGLMLRILETDLES